MTQAASATHVVVIPSYDTGPTGLPRRCARRAAWQPVPAWSSMAAATARLTACRRWPRSDPGLRVWLLPHNRGKGAAVLHGLQQAHAAGFSHALTMDADGQHPPTCIGAFMQRQHAAARGNDPRAAGVRCQRAAAACADAGCPNWWTNLETLGAGVDDSLFGFRVYPIADLLAVMQRPALDAALRLRHRGGGAPGLARRQADQPRRAGEVPDRRRRAACRTFVMCATTRC